MQLKLHELLIKQAEGPEFSPIQTGGRRRTFIRSAGVAKLLPHQVVISEDSARSGSFFECESASYLVFPQYTVVEILISKS